VQYWQPKEFTLRNAFCTFGVCDRAARRESADLDFLFTASERGSTVSGGPGRGGGGVKNRDLNEQRFAVGRDQRTGVFAKNDGLVGGRVWET